MDPARSRARSPARQSRCRPPIARQPTRSRRADSGDAGGQDARPASRRNKSTRLPMHPRVRVARTGQFTSLRHGVGALEKPVAAGEEVRNFRGTCRDDSAVALALQHLLLLLATGPSSGSTFAEQRPGASAAGASHPEDGRDVVAVRRERCFAPVVLWAGWPIPGARLALVSHLEAQHVSASSVWVLRWPTRSASTRSPFQRPFLPAFRSGLAYPVLPGQPPSSVTLVLLRPGARVAGARRHPGAIGDLTGSSLRRRPFRVAAGSSKEKLALGNARIEVGDILQVNRVRRSGR